MSKRAILNYAAHVLAYRVFFGMDGDVQCFTQRDVNWVNRKAKQVIAKLAQERLAGEKARLTK